MSGQRPPRRTPRRRYPLSAYLPFALMVTVLMLLVVVAVVLVLRLAAAAGHASPPATATPAAIVSLSTATAPPPTATLAHPVGATPTAPTPTVTVTPPPHATPATPPPSATVAPRPHATPTARGIPPTAPAKVGTPRPTVTPLRSVTIALDSTPDGAPVGAATVIHGAHIKLWAFVSVPNIHAGDTIRFVWRDLDHNAIVENWPQPVQVNSPLYTTRMYAYPGAGSPSRPFPPGHYRVDVYRNLTLVASGAFSVASH